MKKNVFLLFFCFLGSILWGYSEYWEINYSIAKVAYKQGNYIEGKNALKEVALYNIDTAILYMKILNKISSPEIINFYSQVKLKFGETAVINNLLANYYLTGKKYKNLIKFYENIKIKTPLCKYCAGIAYFKTGEKEKGHILLKEIEKNKNLKPLVLEFLKNQKIESEALEKLWKKEEVIEKIKEKKWELFFSLSSAYSNNVAFRPSDSRLLYPYTNEGDAYLTGFLSGKYRFYKNNRWLWELEGSIYRSYHFHLEDFDLFGLALKLNGYYKLENKDYIKLSFYPEYYWLDNNSYLRKYGTEIGYKKYWNNRCSSYFAYTIQDNDYFLNNDRDGIYNELKIENAYKLNKKLLCGLIFGIGKNNAHFSYDYNKYFADIFGYYQINNKNLLKIGTKVKRYNYLHHHRFWNVKRNDTFYMPYLSYYYFVNKNMYLNLSFNFITNDSNIAYLDYDKRTLKFSINFLF